MAAVISILILLCCIVLVLAVLIQNPKGGGLASGFSSGSQVMGVRRTADFLEKATWTLAVMLFVFSIASAGMGGATGNSSDDASTTKDKAGDFEKTAPAPANNGGGMIPGAPTTPAPAPPAGQP